MKTITCTLIVILGLGLSSARADEVSDFLQLLPRPDGVVFEIMKSGENELAELLPKIRKMIEAIRIENSEIEFAIVSHGQEEFALQTSNQGQYSEIHSNVRSLVAEDIPVYVCETLAGWKGVTAEDFPDYVNVAPTGPGQINLYRDLGYHLIVVE